MTKQERLKLFAKNRHLTMTELASRLGMSREAVSRIAGGKQDMTSAFEGKFIRAFGPNAWQEVFGDAHSEPAEVAA